MKHSKAQLLFIATLFTLFFVVSPTKALAVVQTINGDGGQNQTITSTGNITVNDSGSTHTIGWTGLLPISSGGTGASSFTTGSIPFISGGVFSQDNSNFFWDNTNKRLGIGTSSPASNLSVAGNASVSGDLIVNGNITSSNLVPYTGATDNLNLGNHSITLGIQNGHGNIFGANAPDVGGQTGSAITIKAGTGKNTYGGGYVEILGGAAAAGGWGGDVFLVPGDGGSGNSDGGNLEFRTGKKSGSGNDGKFKFLNPDQTHAGIFNFSLLGSSDKTYSFPNFTGTFGLIEANQIWSGLNNFEANSNSTIYVGSSSKSGCIALGDSDGSGVTYVTANDGVLSASSTKPGICQ